MIDAYGRKLRVLRLIVTLRCNYNCIFCHKEGQVVEVQELPAGVYGVLAEAFASLGVISFKLTGGEPLVRKDIVDIVDEVKTYGRPYDISLTTNGYFLVDLVHKLREAGLHRLNVSLHSLDKNMYKYITGVDGFHRVIRGIEKALDEGIKVKINFTLLRGLNDNDVPQLIDYVVENKVNLSLIELHPVGKGKEVFNEHHQGLDDIKGYIKRKFSNVKVILREQNNREIYVIDNGVFIEFICPIDNPNFCLGCNRLRVDCSGGLRICLNDPNVKYSLFEILSSGKDRCEKVKEVIKAILNVNKLRKPYNTFNLTTLPNYMVKNISNKYGFRVPLVKEVGIGII